MHMQRAHGLLAVLVLATCALSVNVVTPPGVDATLDALRSHPIHDFLDASCGEVLLRDPKAVARMGLARTSAFATINSHPYRASTRRRAATYPVGSSNA